MSADVYPFVFCIKSSEYVAEVKRPEYVSYFIRLDLMVWECFRKREKSFCAWPFFGISVSRLHRVCEFERGRLWGFCLTSGHFLSSVGHRHLSLFSSKCAYRFSWNIFHVAQIHYVDNFVVAQALRSKLDQIYWDNWLMAQSNDYWWLIRHSCKQFSAWQSLL